MKKIVYCLVIAPVCVLGAMIRTIEEYRPLNTMSDQEIQEWAVQAHWVRSEKNFQLSTKEMARKNNKKNTSASLVKPSKKLFKQKYEPEGTPRRGYDVFRGDIIPIERAIFLSHLFYLGQQQQFLWRCPVCHRDPHDIHQHCKTLEEFKDHFYREHVEIDLSERFKDWSCRACGLYGEQCRAVGDGQDRFARILNHIDQVAKNLAKRFPYPAQLERIFKVVVKARGCHNAHEQYRELVAIGNEKRLKKIYNSDNESDEHSTPSRYFKRRVLYHNADTSSDSEESDEASGKFKLEHPDTMNKFFILSQVAQDFKSVEPLHERILIIDEDENNPRP